MRIVSNLQNDEAEATEVRGIVGQEILTRYERTANGHYAEEPLDRFMII